MSKRGISKFCVVLLSCAVMMLSGCASTQYVADERDPWQGFNRSMYGFNDGLDRAILKPAAKSYKAIAPDFVETGVRNFFDNLDDISVAVNNLLQGKVSNAFSDIGRLAINSTIGILGFFDVASSMGMTKHDEDFGQTLGVWGMDSGPYIMWPIFGPSTLRDSPSLVVDRVLLNPLTYVEIKTGERIAVVALDVVSVRAELLSLEETVDEISTDRYTFIREAYLDRRDFLVNDGSPSGDSDLYDELDDE
ncbi:MAG: VacJ family lipoprotein [Gammaproteobacteria bacterium]